MEHPNEKTESSPHEDVRIRNYQMTELAIVKFRWMLIAFLAFIFIVLDTQQWPVPTLNTLLLVACIYNFCIYLYNRKIRPFSFWIMLLFLYCDMVIVAVGMFFTGGARSPFLFIWYLTLFTAGLRFGFFRSFALQIPMALYYLFLLYQNPGPHDPEFSSWAALGLFSFLIIAIYGSQILREEQFTFKVIDSVHQKSIIDRLTGLYNYAYFIDELGKELARAERSGSHFALILFDLDFFKQVNDTYGHEKGNILLKAIADILTVSARKMDTVARYGGEEFIILMPNSNGSEREIAERIRKRIQETEFMGIAEGPLRITMSGGICAYPKDSTSINGLLDTADKGLYLAKTTGRNRICSCEPTPPQASHLQHS